MTKQIFLFLLFFSWTLSLIAKEEKISKEKEAKAFQEIQALIDSRHFQVEIDHVHPQNGFDVSRFNPRGKITITNSTAQGYLPFFGRAYSLPHSQGGGIEFDNKIKEIEIKTVKKRKKQFVMFNFSVQGNYDVFQISIEAMSNGSCFVSVHSNNRAQISYTGTISSILKQEENIKKT